MASIEPEHACPGFAKSMQQQESNEKEERRKAEEKLMVSRAG
jgi:hypothetical protein